MVEFSNGNLIFLMDWSNYHLIEAYLHDPVNMRFDVKQKFLDQIRHSEINSWYECEKK